MARKNPTKAKRSQKATMRKIRMAAKALMSGKIFPDHAPYVSYNKETYGDVLAMFDVSDSDTNIKKLARIHDKMMDEALARNRAVFEGTYDQRLPARLQRHKKRKRNPLRDLPRAGFSPHEYEKFIKDKKGYIGVWLTGYSGYATVTAFLINKKPTGGRGAAWPKGTKYHRIGTRSYKTWNGAVTRYRNLTSPKRIKDFFGEQKYEAARRKVFPKKRGRKPAAKGRRYKRWTLPPLSEAEFLTGDHGNVMYYIYQLEHKPTGILGHGGSPKSALEDLKKNLDFEFGK